MTGFFQNTEEVNSISFKASNRGRDKNDWHMTVDSFQLNNLQYSKFCIIRLGLNCFIALQLGTTLACIYRDEY